MASPQRPLPFLSALLVLALAAPATRAELLTVGPVGDHADIQSAVDAASDWDVILVASGTYAGFTIDDKRVCVAADTGAAVIVGGQVVVRDLAASRDAALVGLTIGTPDNSALPALHLLDNAGSVRVDDCALSGGWNTLFSDDPPGLGALVEASADVALSRSQCTGGSVGILRTGGAAGLEASASTVVLTDVVLIGGQGGQPFGAGPAPGTDGGPGLRAAGCVLFAARSTITGGMGGVGAYGEDFIPPQVGGTGGAGVELAGGAVLRRLGGSISGGAGGPGADALPFPGFTDGIDGQPGPASVLTGGSSLVVVAGTPRGFHMPVPAREGEPIELSFQGLPGDLAAVFFGLDSSTFWKAGFHGHLLLDFASPTVLVIFGTVPASGELIIPLAFDDLGPGLEAVLVPFQAAFRDTAGVVTLGPPVSQVIVDGAL